MPRSTPVPPPLVWGVVGSCRTDVVITDPGRAGQGKVPFPTTGRRNEHTHPWWCGEWWCFGNWRNTCLSGRLTVLNARSHMSPGDAHGFAGGHEEEHGDNWDGMRVYPSRCCRNIQTRAHHRLFQRLDGPDPDRKVGNLNHTGLRSASAVSVGIFGRTTPTSSRSCLLGYTNAGVLPQVHVDERAAPT